MWNGTIQSESYLNLVVFSTCPLRGPWVFYYDETTRVDERVSSEGSRGTAKGKQQGKGRAGQNLLLKKATKLKRDPMYAEYFQMSFFTNLCRIPVQFHPGFHTAMELLKIINRIAVSCAKFKPSPKFSF